ncbi:MAG: septum formation inhibitor Maf, partial [Ignavibacteriales bacterium]|nr:septum formation inhibitor Maf [Ignavibacteriales bacterium]
MRLKQIGINFSVLPSAVDERFDTNRSPSHNAKRIALEKALDVAKRVELG